MNDIIILFASKMEADWLINHSPFKFEKMENKYFISRNNEKTLKIWIVGIGKKSVLRWVSRHASLPEVESLIIKAGACGLPDESIPLMTAFVPQWVGYENKRMELNIKNIPPYLSSLVPSLTKHKGLLTVDRPLTDPDKGKQLIKAGFGAVDMESWFLMEHFRENIFIPLIIGTDRGNQQAKEDFFTQIREASVILGKKLIQLIEGTSL